MDEGYGLIISLLALIRPSPGITKTIIIWQ